MIGWLSKVTWLTDYVGGRAPKALCILHDGRKTGVGLFKRKYCIRLCRSSKGINRVCKPGMHKGQVVLWIDEKLMIPKRPVVYSIHAFAGEGQFLPRLLSIPVMAAACLTIRHGCHVCCDLFCL